ncbi:hypothetical protein H4R35_006768 [Dimargaris xerosporica]|nr:hypothetical protein H4R35_006768 [Dimargaris xerosporica]
MLPASELQDYQRIGTLTNMVRLMAGLGLFGSIATIIGTVVLFRRQRNFWSRVALFVALADGIDAMAKQGVRDPLVAGPASFGCQLQGMVIQAATLVSLLSAALVPLNLAACVFARSYAIRLQRSQQPILLALVTVSVILAIIPLATRSKHGLRGYGDADLWYV